MISKAHRQIARRALLLAMAAFTASAAVGATIPPGTVLAARQEMVRNNLYDPESLDPALVESGAASNILDDLFEALTASDHSGKVVPGVAESWKQIDAVTWIFKLRRNAVWSNGESVTADDFVYAWRRFTDPKTAAPLGATFAGFILNGSQIVAGKMPTTALGVRAIDRTTLEVKTPYPEPFLPQVLGEETFDPVPKATVEKFGKDWMKPGNMVSNGAYVLTDWQVNNRVVVTKDPMYWDAANVTLTRVTYLCIEDANADLKRYQSGDEDMMSALPPGTYDALKAAYPRDMHLEQNIGLSFYALNNTDPLLKDVRVRKALSMVIDRDILAKKVTADGQAPVYGLAVKGLGGMAQTRYDWADWSMDQRVAVARKLLVDAGVKPGTTLSFAYNANDYHKKIAVFVASEWKTKLGLETELDSMEFKVLLRKRQSAQYQIARSGFLPGINDATIFLSLVQCGSDSNEDKSCNAKVDDLIRQGTMAADPKRREALMTEAGRLAMEDYPMIPLLQTTTSRLVKPWIGGYDDAAIIPSSSSKGFYVLKH